MYVDLAGLARYKRDFDAWARGALLPKDAAAARVRTAKAGAVSFVPVQETPLDVSVDFLFAETPPASGDKSPSNPSTITGVAQAKVTRCGKNLAPLLDSEYASPTGVTFTPLGDGGYRIHGETNGVNTAHCSLNGGYFWPYKNGATYRVNLFCSTTNIRVIFQAFNSNGTIRFTRTANDGGGTFTNITGDELLNVRISVDKAAGEVDLVVYPQIELGSVTSEFEKPESTDYTLPLGSTYYGGVLDVASGVMTVTWEAYKCTGSSSEGWFLDTANSTSTMNYFRGVPQITRMMGNVSAATRACTHFAYSSTSSVVPSFATWSQTPRIVFRLPLASFPDVATLTSWLASEYNAGHPVTVAYALDQPYAVQLTPTEILSLTQPSDYDPRVNTVYSDASAVQVGYLKHPSAASADLRNALVSLGGGV